MTLKELETITCSRLDYTDYGKGKITVQFEHGEIQEDGCILVTIWGQGKSVLAAERDYVSQLRGELLVIDAYLPTRRTFRIPKTLKAR
jgi:hypothetical protein